MKPGFASDVLQCIGNTPLVPLRRIAAPTGAQILIKLESENPTGSMKDRMALAMIEAAEADGRLTRNGFVVEYSTGNTGVALSFVGAVKRYPVHIVTADAYAAEKRSHMRILGARVEVLRSDEGRMTDELTKRMIARAHAIAERPGSFWTDQLKNRDQLTAYHRLADEIWTEAKGRVDGFVQGVGSGACFVGTAEGLRGHRREVTTVAVEPAESAVLSGGQTGAHRIDGMGAGFVVPLWDPKLADQVETVSSEEAMAMSLRLAREEGLFAGPSTGCNVVAALRVAGRLGSGATVVTVLCDTGMKYLHQYGTMLTNHPEPAGA